MTQRLFYTPNQLAGSLYVPRGGVLRLIGADIIGVFDTQSDRKAAQ